MKNDRKTYQNELGVYFPFYGKNLNHFG